MLAFLLSRPIETVSPPYRALLDALLTIKYRLFRMVLTDIRSGLTSSCKLGLQLKPNTF